MNMAGPPSAHPRALLAATILASSLAFVDGSVVNVGLPAIARSLQADAAQLQWVINAYLLPLSALLLLGGAAGDRFGRRRLLIGGTALFALASLLCALAPDAHMLLAARFLQGVSSAILMPNSLAILGANFQGEAKGRAVGTWAAAGAALGAVGPVLGGWLIDLGSWRSIFLINLPLAAGAIALACRYVPSDRPAPGHPLDLAGGVFATLSLGTLTGALTLGAGRGGWSTRATVLGCVALAAAVLFLVLERRRGARAMMPLALFGSAPFIGLSLLTLLLYGALGALFVLVPYLMIEAAGYSATAAGAALLPLPLLLALASPYFGARAARRGTRAALTAGGLLVAVGFALAGSPPHGSYWTGTLPAILVISLGMSIAVAPLTTAVLNSVDDAYTGAASGFNSAVARSGGLIATALLGSVLATHGAQLLAGYRVAMLSCAVACVAAAGCAWGLLRAPPE